MSGAIMSLVGKRVLAESARNHFGTEDPYFEEVPASRLGRAFGKKTRKRRKAHPPGLSEKDAKILTQVKRRAYRLDYSLFNLCGIQFGWGSVIGLVPFLGDAGDAALAMMVVRNCQEVDGGLPSHLRMMMLFNVVIDFFIGLIPFVGDIADAVYKCNTRNAVILEKHLREKGTKALKKQAKETRQQAQTQPQAIDYSLPDEWDKQESGVVGDRPPTYEEQGPSGYHPRTDNTASAQLPQGPQPAQKPRTHGGIGKWFGGASRQDEDLERGGA